MWRPSDPKDWGLGGHKPADWEGPDTEPFTADQPPRDTEDAVEPARLPPGRVPPGRCVITCVTPFYAMRRRRWLIVRYGDEWLDRLACPVCGEWAMVELARPVEDCPDCGGSGHVHHELDDEEQGPGALRLALGQARDVLRIKAREA